LQGRNKKPSRHSTAIHIFRFTDDQYDPELAATIGVDFKVKVGAQLHMEVLTFLVEAFVVLLSILRDHCRKMTKILVKFGPVQKPNREIQWWAVYP
jgi:hypothetical protein